MSFSTTGSGVAGSMNAAFNSTTLGSLITTGGNIGIGTTSPAFTLDVNGTVKSNNVKWNYYASSNPTLSGEATGYNTALISSSNFSNGRFTATIAGNYFVTASAYVYINSGTGAWRLLKNGTTIYGFVEGSSTTSNSFGTISAVVPLAVGDYVSVFSFTGTVKIDSNCFFSGFLIV